MGARDLPPRCGKPEDAGDFPIGREHLARVEPAYVYPPAGNPPEPEPELGGFAHEDVDFMGQPIPQGDGRPLSQPWDEGWDGWGGELDAP